MVKKTRNMTFKVSENTYSRLKELAEMKELSMTVVVEQMVRNEYDKLREESE